MNKEQEEEAQNFEEEFRADDKGTSQCSKVSFMIYQAVVLITKSKIDIQFEYLTTKANVALSHKM